MADQEILRMVATLRDDASAVLKRLQANMQETARSRGMSELSSRFKDLGHTVNPLVQNIKDGLVPTLNTLGITSLTTAGIVGGLFYGMQRLSQSTAITKGLSDQTRVATQDIGRFRRAGEEMGVAAEQVDE